MLKNKKFYTKYDIKKHALNYLNKFGTSKNYLINFLVKKIKNRYLVSDSNLLQQDIENIIVELTNLGFLNDTAFSESRIKSLLKEGNSIFNITLRLKKKNISQANIDEALRNIINNIDNSMTLVELDKYALLKYAKKRNALLWQYSDINLVDTNKIINSLLRKGFSFNLVEELINQDNQLNYDREYFEYYLYNIEKKFNF